MFSGIPSLACPTRTPMDASWSWLPNGKSWRAKKSLRRTATTGDDRFFEKLNALPPWKQSSSDNSSLFHRFKISFDKRPRNKNDALKKTRVNDALLRNRCTRQLHRLLTTISV